VAILPPISAVGAALHIAALGVSKITLFFAAGSIYTAAHKTEVSAKRVRKAPDSCLLVACSTPGTSFGHRL
jgi:formate hydrogenlyase subunit 3/multisubunit Na+/H+ antiporter MnhD subunit